MYCTMERTQGAVHTGYPCLTNFWKTEGPSLMVLLCVTGDSGARVQLPCLIQLFYSMLRARECSQRLPSCSPRYLGASISPTALSSGGYRALHFCIPNPPRVSWECPHQNQFLSPSVVTLPEVVQWVGNTLSRGSPDAMARVVEPLFVAKNGL